MPDHYSKRPSAASRKLLNTLPSEADTAAALRNLKDASDFSLAITGAAYLQHMIERLIKSKCVSLRKEDEQRMFDGGQNGFLSSFSSQVRLCFALGWIDHTCYEDLLLINDIRNTFAHSMHAVDFHHPNILSDCERIKLRLSPHQSPGEVVEKNPGFFLLHNAVLLYVITIRAAALGMPVNNSEDLQAASISLFSKSIQE